MAVNLTVSETLDGSQVADTLADSGGGPFTGIDLGSVTNGSYSPQTAGTNAGNKPLFVRHDATVDQITDTKTYIAEYNTNLPNTYGGADTVGNDYTRIKAMGSNSGDSKDNSDNLSQGIWVDHDATTSEANQFDYTARGTDGTTTNGNGTIIKYGDNSDAMAVSLATAFIIPSEAMVIDSDQTAGSIPVPPSPSAGFIASAPVDGEIGINGSGTLGDNAFLKMRVYIAGSETQGGIHQVEWVIAYSFTA